MRITPMSFLRLNTVSDLSSSADEMSPDQGAHFNNRPVEQSADLGTQKVNPEADILSNAHLPANYTATHPEPAGRLIVSFSDLVKQHLLDCMDVSDLPSLLFVCKNLFTPEQILSKRAQHFMQYILNAMQAIGHNRTIEDIKFVFSASHFSIGMDFDRYVLKAERSFARLYEQSCGLLAQFLDKGFSAELGRVSESMLGYHHVAFQIYQMVIRPRDSYLLLYHGDWRKLLDRRQALAEIFHELEMVVKMINDSNQENPEPILELSGRPLNQSRPCLQIQKIPYIQQVKYLFEDSDAAFVPPELFNKPETIREIYFPDGLLELPLQILQCVNLTTLILLGCTYLETLPPEIGQLQNLKRLTLPVACSSFTKPRLRVLPDEIIQLKNLEMITFNASHRKVLSLDCYDNHACVEHTCTYFFQDFSPVQQNWLQELQENRCHIEELYVPEALLEPEVGPFLPL